MQAAGIPYFTLPELWIFKPFGILVAIGVIVGARLIQRRVERLELDEEHARNLIYWAVGAGLVGAHVFDVLAYQPGALERDPLLLIKLWAGISSFGGFIGGTLGVTYYIRRHRLPYALWADTIMIGLVPGFTFGRLGCTIVHDHIGRATDFPLAQNYTAEVVAAHGYRIEPGLHHNLGMYEFVFMLLLCGLVWLLERKRRPAGMVVATTITLYAPVRILMDFLRLENSDPRYLGLTFAQWMSALLCVLGVVWLMRLWLQDPPPEPEETERPAKAAGGKTRSNAGATGPGRSASGRRKKRKRR